MEFDLIYTYLYSINYVPFIVKHRSKVDTLRMSVSVDSTQDSLPWAQLGSLRIGTQVRMVRLPHRTPTLDIDFGIC